MELREHVHHAGVYGEPRSPTDLPIERAELHSNAERLDRVNIAMEQRDDRLGDDQWNIALQPVAQALLLMGDEVDPWREVHPNFIAADLDRIGAHVVSPLVEGPATGEIKAGVVPMAGED